MVMVLLFIAGVVDLRHMKQKKSLNPANRVSPQSDTQNCAMDYWKKRGGINVIYESDDFEDGLQHLLESEEFFSKCPNLISVAADLHPYNVIMDGKNNPQLEKDKGITLLQMVERDQNEELPRNPDLYVPGKEALLDGGTMTNSININKVLFETKLIRME